MYTVAVDIGGTFTDVVVIDDASGQACGKSLTTPGRPAAGRDATVSREAAGERGLQLGALLIGTGRMVHATTQSTNAVFAFSGAKTAVLATRGFGDTLMIMRATGRVAGLSRIRAPPLPRDAEAATPCRRARHFRDPERVDHPGASSYAARRGAVLAAAREVRRARVPVRWRSRTSSRTKTRRTNAARASILRAEAPELYVSLSSRRRAGHRRVRARRTALFNAYVGPVIEGYLDRLDGRCGCRPPAEAADRPGERRRDDDGADRADLHGRVGSRRRAS